MGITTVSECATLIGSLLFVLQSGCTHSRLERVGQEGNTSRFCHNTQLIWYNRSIGIDINIMLLILKYIK